MKQPKYHYHTIKNYTGHPLTITDMESMVTLPSDGKARLNSSRKVIGDVTIKAGENHVTLPVNSVKERAIVGLPDAEEGVLIVVSGIVASFANRPDVVAPGHIHRSGGHGRVSGCRAFVRPEIKE